MQKSAGAQLGPGELRPRRRRPLSQQEAIVSSYGSSGSGDGGAIGCVSHHKSNHNHNNNNNNSIDSNFLDSSGLCIDQRKQQLKLLNKLVELKNGLQEACLIGGHADQNRACKQHKQTNETCQMAGSETKHSRRVPIEDRQNREEEEYGEQNDDEDEDEEDEVEVEEEANELFQRRQVTKFGRLQQMADLLGRHLNASIASRGCCQSSTLSTGDSSGFLSDQAADSSASVATLGHRSCSSGASSSSPSSPAAMNKQSWPASNCNALIDRLGSLMGQSQSHSQSQLHFQTSLKLEEEASNGANSELDWRPSTTPTVRDSTLVRGREFDYSTLCRDEFSSFIPASRQDELAKLAKTQQNDEKKTSSNNDNKKISNRHKKKTQQKLSNREEPNLGPILIGVHENSVVPTSKHQEDIEAMANSSSDSLTTDSNDTSTSDELNQAEEEEEEMKDDEINDEEEESQEVASISLELSSDSQTETEEAQLEISVRRKETMLRTSKILDSYLKRVNLLCRVIKGDKSVSLNEAFDVDEHEDGGLIKVSQENKTKIEFSPLKQSTFGTKVIQEIECELEGQTEADKSDIFKEIRITEENFLSILSAAQTSAKLNWILDLDNQKYLSNGGNINHPVVSDGDLGNTIVPKLKPLDRSKLTQLIMMNELAGGQQQVQTTNHTNGHLLQRRKIIERHVDQFIDCYNKYQLELHLNCSFANDWHENWLFAYKRQVEDNGTLDGPMSKRVKLSPFIKSENEYEKQNDSISNICNDLTKSTYQPQQSQQDDLFHYSTLILSKLNATSRFDYLMREYEHDSGIDQLYQIQPDIRHEIYINSIESKGQPDMLKQFLLCSSLDSLNDCSLVNAQSHQRLIDIYYDSNNSNQTNLVEKITDPFKSNKLILRAFGYLISIKNLTKLTKFDLIQKILDKILTQFSSTIEKPIGLNIHKDRVKFDIKIADVELSSSDLSIVQFCARVSGSLPIKVSWFKLNKQTGQEEVELSNYENIIMKLPKKEAYLKFINSNNNDGTKENININWPNSLKANYDFKYQSEWSSWFRFKRYLNDIMFEISNLNKQFDFEQTYKCSIENLISKDECIFTLKERKKILTDETNIDCNNVPIKRKLEAKKRNGGAFLRTWSQRTLNRPAPLTDDRLSDQLDKENQIDETEMMMMSDERAQSKLADQSESSSGGCMIRSTLLTVGRRSAVTAALDSRDKFGKDYPYYPENLLKRLESNRLITSSTSLDTQRARVALKRSQLEAQVSIEENETLELPAATQQNGSQQNRPMGFELNDYDVEEYYSKLNAQKAPDNQQQPPEANGNLKLFPPEQKLEKATKDDQGIESIDLLTELNSAGQTRFNEYQEANNEPVAADRRCRPPIQEPKKSENCSQAEKKVRPTLPAIRDDHSPELKPSVKSLISRFNVV